MRIKNALRYTLALIIIVLGFATLFLSSSIVFDLFGIRAKEGNYVLFVVLANLVCSILYLLAGYGIITKKGWVTKILSSSLIVLLLAFTGLLVHINMNGIYETKTIGALTFRIAITVLFVSASYLLNKSMKNEH
ncbi:MAG: hypothetical protein JXQ69_05115 [Paludibacteraceae bacterium]|nr:hypothetical protein [Paludibacteraceae bacterium]MBN2787690.1 hypothetical protein [Paludibacteraceae bacterium]